MEERKQIRWDEMVKELCAGTSMANMAHRLGVRAKEIKRWKQGEARPQGRNAEALIEECHHRAINWKKFLGLIPIYDFRNSYDKNVLEGPQGLDIRYEQWIPEAPISLFGVQVNSLLGVPSSVLTINSHWIEPFTNLGLDVITAKTVRTREKRVHPVPNGLYVSELKEALTVGALPEAVRATPDFVGPDVTKISLANSFGMPSPEPAVWQADLQRTKGLLKHGQILIASVVGTADEVGSTPGDLVADFVKCARLAYEVGPHAIELNTSCPNAYGQEGAVYQDSDLAGRICRQVRADLKDARLLIKIGYLPPDKLDELFKATYRYIDGFTAINTLYTKVISDGQQEEPAFPGTRRVVGGLSGVAIRNHALEMVRGLRDRGAAKKQELVILGVGGISSVADVKLFVNAGADAVQICTAALHNPYIGIEIRKQLYEEKGRASPCRSTILERTGLSIPFRDKDTAKLFDMLLKTCDSRRAPLEVALGVFQEKWLNHITPSDTANQHMEAPQKTRRVLPTTAQIETWIQDAIKENRYH